MRYKKKLIIAIFSLSLILLGYWKRLFFIVMFYNSISWFTPIDKDFIVKREWLSETGSIIRFDDESKSFRNDTIFSNKKPYCKVTNLNKKFNEITVFSFTKKMKVKYISTEEFVK